jgi:hypothetical protein
VRYKRLCGCRVSSLDDEDIVRRSSSLARSRQGSAPLDAHYSAAQYQTLPGDDRRGGEDLSSPSGYERSSSGLTAPLNVPTVHGPMGDGGGNDGGNGAFPNASSPRSYSDQSVFHRSSHGLILGKKRGSGGGRGGP